MVDFGCCGYNILYGKLWNCKIEMEKSEVYRVYEVVKE